MVSDTVPGTRYCTKWSIISSSWMISLFPVMCSVNGQKVCVSKSCMKLDLAACYSATAAQNGTVSQNAQYLISNVIQKAITINTATPLN